MRVRRIAGLAVVVLNIGVVGLLMALPSNASATTKRAKICENLECTGGWSCGYREGYGCSIISGGGICWDGPCIGG